MGWAGYVAPKGKLRNAYKISVKTCEGKKPPGIDSMIILK
jgi:hypothetical protein